VEIILIGAEFLQAMMVKNTRSTLARQASLVGVD
jgi:hypothetical protein